MKLGGFLADYGITVKAMNLQIALPEAVMKAIDERAVMGAMGGMEAYAFKKAGGCSDGSDGFYGEKSGRRYEQRGRNGNADGRRNDDGRTDGEYDGRHDTASGRSADSNGMAQQTAAPAAGDTDFAPSAEVLSHRMINSAPIVVQNCNRKVIFNEYI